MSQAPAVFLRPAISEDAAAIAEIYNEAIRDTVATFDTEPKSVAERIAWLAAHDERHPVWVAEIEDTVVGWACLNAYSDRAAYDDTGETSFYVHSSQRGRGIGRSLMQELVAEARRLGYHTLLARISEGSDASLHLSAEVGFLPVGTLREVGYKFGRRIDVHILQMILK